MKITQDMVGLTIHKVTAYRTNEFNEYNVVLRLKEISDEGLDLFDIVEEDI